MVIGSFFVNVYSLSLFYATGYTWFFLSIPDGIVGMDYPLFIVSRISKEPKGVAFVLRVTILPFW